MFLLFSLFLSLLSIEACRILLSLGADLWSMQERNTFACYFRWKLPHAYFLACTTHCKKCSSFSFHFYTLFSNIRHTFWLVVVKFLMFSRLQVCLIDDLLSFFAHKNNQNSHKTSPFLLFFCVPPTHNIMKLYGYFCPYQHLLHEKGYVMSTILAFFVSVFWYPISKQILTFYFHFLNRLFFTASGRFSQDVVSIMLAIAKIHVESSLASPWSSRLITVEVLWRWFYHCSHMYWFTMADTTIFQNIVSDNVSWILSFWVSIHLISRIET